MKTFVPETSILGKGKYPDNKVHGANMGPTWVLLAPDGPHEPCYQGSISKYILQNTEVCNYLTMP